MNSIDTLQSRLATKTGLDPLTIIMILAALIPLLETCFTATSDPKRLRRRPLTLPRLAAAIHRQTGWSFERCRDAAASVCDLADGATDDELRSLIEECQS